MMKDTICGLRPEPITEDELNQMGLAICVQCELPTSYQNTVLRLNCGFVYCGFCYYQPQGHDCPAKGGA